MSTDISQSSKSSSHGPPDDHISECYSSILAVFKRILFGLSPSDNVTAYREQFDAAEILDLYGRLNIWGEQSGAAIPWTARGSLDHKLRKDVELSTLALDQLQLIGANLRQVAQLIESSDKPQIRSGADSVSSASVDSEDEGNEENEQSRQSRKYQRLVQHIDENIKALYKFSALLRRPLVEDKFLSSKRKHVDISTDVTENCDVAHVYEKIKEWSQGTSFVADDEQAPVSQEIIERRMTDFRDFSNATERLCYRLGSANTRRREQLQYWAHHPESLKPLTTDVDADVLLTSANPQVQQPVEPDDGLVNPIPPGKEPSEASRAKTTISALSFSAVALSAIDDNATIEQVARTIYEPSEGGGLTSRVRVPQIPKRNPDMDEFTCPFCLSSLDFEIMEDRAAWKRHVFRDLRPYVCTFPDCQSPSKLYATRHDWFYHEMQMHRVEWVCSPSCQFSSNNRAVFRQHLTDKHNDVMYQNQVDSFLDLCRRPVDDNQLSQCPLCLADVNNLQLFAHLGKHLEDISLFVARTDVDDEREDKHEADSDLAQNADHSSREETDQVSNTSLSFSTDQDISISMPIVDSITFQESLEKIGKGESPAMAGMRSTGITNQQRLKEWTSQESRRALEPPGSSDSDSSIIAVNKDDAYRSGNISVARDSRYGSDDILKLERLAMTVCKEFQKVPEGFEAICEVIQLLAKVLREATPPEGPGAENIPFILDTCSTSLYDINESIKTYRSLDLRKKKDLQTKHELEQRFDTHKTSLRLIIQFLLRRVSISQTSTIQEMKHGVDTLMESLRNMGKIENLPSHGSVVSDGYADTIVDYTDMGSTYTTDKNFMMQWLNNTTGDEPLGVVAAEDLPKALTQDIGGSETISKDFGVALTDGNLIMDCEVPPKLLDYMGFSRHQGQNEFTHRRVSVVTCKPQEFYQQRYTLRPLLLARPRKIRIVIVVFLDVTDTSILKTVRTLLEALEYLHTNTQRRNKIVSDPLPGDYNGDYWKHIVVVFVKDNRFVGKDYSWVLDDLFHFFGLYDARRSQFTNLHRVREALIHEYTTQIGLSQKWKFKIAKAPCQMMLIEQASRHAFSSLWISHAVGAVLTPEILMPIQGGSVVAKDAVQNLYFSPNPVKVWDPVSGEAGVPPNVAELRNVDFKSPPKQEIVYPDNVTNPIDLNLDWEESRRRVEELMEQRRSKESVFSRIRERLKT